MLYEVITGIQSQAILDMRLARLAALEVEKLQEELAALQKLIEKLKGILRSTTKLLNVIKKELLEVKKSYATSRRTRIVKAEDKQLPSAEDFVIVEPIVSTVTKNGFIKYMSQKTYSRSDTTATMEDLSSSDVPISIRNNFV